MDLQNNLALLTQTPATLNALLRNLPAAWTEANEGENTWTPSDIVAHMANAERDEWVQRVRVILDHGETRPFDPFHREAFRNEKQSLSETLDIFATLRNQNLATVRAFNFTAADLERRGIHPDFGPVTLGQLISTWATHDLTHLHQMTRTLAHQNREDVGPWKAFLGVLKCGGIK